MLGEKPDTVQHAFAYCLEGKSISKEGHELGEHHREIAREQYEFDGRYG